MSTADRPDPQAGPRPVRLRGHHLLCILTYVGKGYSAGFVAAMDAVVDRIRAGAPVDLVDGPDDICAALMDEAAEPHCVLASAADRDVKAIAAMAAVLHVRPAPGGRLGTFPMEAARAAFRTGATREACRGCPWTDLCTAVAETRFAGTRLAATTGALRPR